LKEVVREIIMIKLGLQLKGALLRQGKAQCRR